MNQIGNAAKPLGQTRSTGSENTQKRRQMAILAKRLFDFYPPQETANPEVFLAGVIELFEAYPEDVAVKAVSVVFGIPSKFKWIPRISEIKQFLDDLMPDPAPNYFPRLPPVDRGYRPTYEELQERCARDGLIIGKTGRGTAQTSAKAAAEFREKFGVSQEAWNAIPDAN